MYSEPGIYSCITTQLGAQTIATTIASLHARGRRFDLDVFAGVMFTRSDNDAINAVTDLKDKIIGSQVISNFPGAQSQFFVMQQNGLDYIMDPKQVVFYSTCFTIATLFVSLRLRNASKHISAGSPTSFCNSLFVCDFPNILFRLYPPTLALLRRQQRKHREGCA
jgi:hypothetical protein